MPVRGAAGARIGFDATRALRNGTGLGNYARGVLRGLHQIAPDIALHLYSPRPARLPFAGLAAEIAATEHRPAAPWRRAGMRAWWRTFRLGRVVARDGMQLYHGLTQEIPRDLARSGVPSVVSVADLLYVTHPALFPAIDRRSYLWRYRWSAEHADAVVAISSWTRHQLHTAFGIPLARIAVIPPVRDARFATPSSPGMLQRAREQYRLPARYLVMVGTLEPRKNQHLALRALAHLGPDAPPLVLIGRDGGSAAALRLDAERLGVSDRVHFLDGVTDEELPILVQGAAAALYLSRAEGFGMPIVEALSAGIPVIALDGPHLRDAGGEVVHYVPDDDPETLAATLDRLLRSDGDEELGAARRRYADRFDAVPLAQRLLGVYDAVLGGHPLPGGLAPAPLLTPLPLENRS